MTREDRLYAMRMQELVIEAEKLGIKVNKKGSKAKAVEKILEAEAALLVELKEQAEVVANTESTLSVPMPVEYDENGPHLIEKEEEPVAESEEPVAESEETEKPKKERKPRKPMDRTVQHNFEEQMEQVCADHDIIVKRWEKIPNLVALRFADTNKTFAEVRFTRKGVRLNVHTITAEALIMDVNPGVGYTPQKNYYLPAVLDVVPYETEEGSDLFNARDLITELVGMDRDILKPHRAEAKTKAAYEEAAAEA